MGGGPEPSDEAIGSWMDYKSGKTTIFDGLIFDKSKASMESPCCKAPMQEKMSGWICTKCRTFFDYWALRRRDEN